MKTKRFNNLLQSAKRGEGKTLLGNMGYLSILQIAGYLFPIITIPYLARVIGAEGYGRIAFASAVMVWIQTIADWGFTLTATRDVAKCRGNKEEVSKIFSETFWARCFLMLISFVILVILILAIPEFRRNAPILLISFLMIPGHIMFPDWFFQAMERRKYTTITNLVVKCVFTMAVFVFIKEQNDYILQPLLTALGYLIAGCYAMWLIIKRWGYRISIVPFSAIRQSIRRSADVFINNLFPNLYNSLSVVLLGFCWGSVANGIYSEGSKFSGIAQNFLNVISRVFYPFLSRRIDKHRLYVIVYMMTTIIVAVSLFVAAPWLIRWFYPDEFLPAIPVARVRAVSLVFSSLSNAYGSCYLIVEGHEKLLRKITMWCSLAGFAVAYPLISHYSYMGVAITVTFSLACLGISSCLAVWRLKRI